MRLIDADEVTQLPFSSEAGTNEWIEDLISKVGLSGEAVDFDCEIEEKAQELCKKVIKGILNIIKTSDTAYDPDNVITEIKEKSRVMCTKNLPHKYYKAIGTRVCEEVIRRGGVECN